MCRNLFEGPAYQWSRFVYTGHRVMKQKLYTDEGISFTGLHAHFSRGQTNGRAQLTSGWRPRRPAEMNRRVDRSSLTLIPTGLMKQSSCRVMKMRSYCAPNCIVCSLVSPVRRHNNAWQRVGSRARNAARVYRFALPHALSMAATLQAAAVAHETSLVIAYVAAHPGQERGDRVPATGSCHFLRSPS